MTVKTTWKAIWQFFFRWSWRCWMMNGRRRRGGRGTEGICWTRTRNNRRNHTFCHLKIYFLLCEVRLIQWCHYMWWSVPLCRFERAENKEIHEWLPVTEEWGYSIWYCMVRRFCKHAHTYTSQKGDMGLIWNRVCVNFSSCCCMHTVRGPSSFSGKL